METKILFLDLDGTVLDSHENVSEENIAAIQKAQAAGIVIAVATGRSTFESQYVLDAIKPDYFAGMNGAIIRNMKTNELIYQRLMDVELIKHMMELMENMGIGYLLQTHQGTYYPTSVVKDLSFAALTDAFMERFSDFFKPIEGDLSKLGVSKLFAMAKDGKAAERFVAEVKHIKGIVAVPVLEDGFDMLPAEQNKAVAAKMICDLLGIEAKHAAAIGDSANDLELLEFVGCSIAPANAVSVIKRVSKHMVPSNDENAIAHAIYEILGVAI
jgi:Cof subfamily protein (haloacid dehalogenase superfamily)